MKLTSETKFFLGTFVAIIIIIIGALAVFSKPAPSLSKNVLLPTGRTSQIGSAQAQHYLVEFSDFQCPACRVFSLEVEKLIQSNPKNLTILYRHFPLPQHPQSKTAAEVAEASGAQGKFWEMASLLFANQESLSEDKYASFAAQLSLDPAKFANERTSTATTTIIAADQAYGESIGINETPTFYLDGVKMELTTPEDFTKQVEQAIR